MAKAKEIGLEAIERMVAFSRDDDDRRLGYEATKFLLNLIGISNEVNLKNVLRSMSYETASRLVDEAFKDLYGKSFDAGKMTIAELAEKCSALEGPRQTI